jgi:acetyl-CoA synthetase
MRFGLHTAGNVAILDAVGYITVLGRADDVLSVAGHRIAKADVESALVSRGSCGEAAVIGKPDPIKGEAIKAFVVLRNGPPQAMHSARKSSITSATISARSAPPPKSSSSPNSRKRAAAKSCAAS